MANMAGCTPFGRWSFKKASSLRHGDRGRPVQHAEHLQHAAHPGALRHRQLGHGGEPADNLGFALWFYNPFSVICRENFPSRVGVLAIRIGDHCFYNPTEAYALT